jgi:hypothetical protein
MATRMEPFSTRKRGYMLQRLTLTASTLALVAALLPAQATLVTSQPPQFASANWLNAPVISSSQFDYSQVNCAAFSSRVKPPNRVLRVSGSEQGRQVSIHDEGSIVYLAGAARFRVGETYRLVRTVQRPSIQEFSGQYGKISQLGRLYQMVGAVQLMRAVNGQAVGVLSYTCRPVEVGDYAVPWAARPNPVEPERQQINLIQSPGYAPGLIVAGTDDQLEFAQGDDVFMIWNRGAVPVRIGQRLLIYRTDQSPSYHGLNTGYITAMSAYPQPGVDVSGLLGTKEPAEIVGQVTVLWTTYGSATGVISFSRDVVYPGDEIAFPTQR